MDSDAILRALDSAPTGILFLDREGRVGHANAAAELQLGLAPGGAHGRRFGDPDWGFVRADGRSLPAGELPVRRTLLSGEPMGMEIAVEQPLGRRVHVAVHATALRGASGEVAGAIVTLSDVTDRYLLQQMLQLRSTSYRMLFESHPRPMWVVDQETLEFLDANDAAIRAYGYSRDEFLAMRVSDIRPIEDVAPLVTSVRAIRAGWMHQGVWRHRLKDGSAIDASIRTHPLDFGGRRAYLTEVTLSADRPVEAAAPVGPSELYERLQLVVSSAPVVLFAIDRAGRFTLSEGRGLEALGLAPGEVVGRSVFEVYAGTPRILENVRRALLGEDLRDIVEVKSGPGEGLHFDTRYIPHRDAQGNVLGILGVATDISDLKRAEDERARLLLKEREARAEAEEARWRASFVAEASRLLASSLHEDTTLQGVARLALGHLADWCLIDLLQDDRSIRRVSVAHVDPALDERAQSLLGTFPLEGPSVGIRRALGSNQSQVIASTGDASLLLLRGGGNEAAVVRELGLASLMTVPLVARFRTLGAISFVSARSGRAYGGKDLELAEDVARRSALALDNASLYRQAQEAIHARDEFLSIASHELRSPLTSLLLQIQYLLDQTRQGASLSTESSTAMLERAEAHVRRLGKLISNLLDISRIGAGRLELEIEAVDLAAVVRDVAARHAEELQRAGSTLTIEADDGSQGLWDRVRLEQVVTNLLVNAMKYGRGKPIEITVRRADGIARLRVRDHGIGIAPEHRERIFERFERAAPERSYGGLGLGLYIVRHIVTALGGHVSVDSQLHEGATFTVELPISGGPQGS